MKSSLRVAILAVAALLGSAVAAASAPESGDALVQRMAQANPDLQSYTASLHIVIAMRSMPYLSPALEGNYYFERPDKEAIVFQTVPILAQQFQKVYPKLDPPAVWPQRYAISVIARSESRSTTTLRLVPKRPGRVAHLDVVVDDATALPSAYTWSYVDGGSVSFEQSYTVVEGNYLVKTQTGRVNLASYDADVSSTFSDFKVNVPIPDNVF